MVDTLPGKRFRSTAQAAPRAIQTTTGRLHLAGLTERGPLEPTLLHSHQEFLEVYGADSRAVGVTADYLECAFGSGVAEAVFARTVGDAAVRATATLNDSAAVAVPTLRVTARDPGPHGNDYDVRPEAGTAAETFRLVVMDDGEDVETYDDLADVGAAVDALLDSPRVRGTDLASGSATPNPAPGAAVPLTGGADDRAGADLDAHLAALDTIRSDRGCGQVALPGQTSGAAHAALIAHGEQRNRIALLDAPNLAGDTALLALPKSDDAIAVSSWVQLAALSGSRLRAVPGSALVAGLIARGDATVGHANHAPAGPDGRSPAVVGVTREIDEGDWTALAKAGVNVIRVDRSSDRAVVELYGFRSRNPDGEYWQANWARQRMAIRHRFDQVAERFLFDLIDGAGVRLGAYKTQLRSILAADHAADALYGAGPDDAFTVDVDDPVNTELTIAAGRLRALTHVRFAPYAELVENNFVKVGLGVPLQIAP